MEWGKVKSAVSESPDK